MEDNPRNQIIYIESIYYFFLSGDPTNFPFLWVTSSFNVSETIYSAIEHVYPVFQPQKKSSWIIVFPNPQ